MKKKKIIFLLVIGISLAAVSVFAFQSSNTEAFLAEIAERERIATKLAENWLIEHTELALEKVDFAASVDIYEGTADIWNIMVLDTSQWTIERLAVNLVTEEVKQIAFVNIEEKQLEIDGRHIGVHHQVWSHNDDVSSLTIGLEEAVALTLSAIEMYHEIDLNESKVEIALFEDLWISQIWLNTLRNASSGQIPDFFIRLDARTGDLDEIQQIYGR